MFYKFTRYSLGRPQGVKSKNHVKTLMGVESQEAAAINSRAAAITS